MIDDWPVCEKLAVFLYAWYTVEFCVEFPFLWCSQVQGQSGGWPEMYVQRCNTKHTRASCHRGSLAIAIFDDLDQRHQYTRDVLAE